MLENPQIEKKNQGQVFNQGGISNYTKTTGNKG